MEAPELRARAEDDAEILSHLLSVCVYGGLDRDTVVDRATDRTVGTRSDDRAWVSARSAAAVAPAVKAGATAEGRFGARRCTRLGESSYAAVGLSGGSGGSGAVTSAQVRRVRLCGRLSPVPYGSFSGAYSTTNAVEAGGT